jgi:hypothetical protein
MWTLIAAIFACTPDVTGAYAEERSRALAVASERVASFEPDLRIQIADADFERAVFAAVRNAVTDVPPVRLQLPLGVSAELRPTVRVQRASVRSSDACPTCLGFETELDGTAAWSVGPASGSLKFGVGAEGVFTVEVEDGHLVRARPRNIGAIRVKVSEFEGLRINPSDSLQDRLRALLTERLPQVALLDLDGAGLPIRDLRIRTGATGITVEALSNVPGALPVTGAEALEQGVRVSISETALLGLARRAAFDKGELTMQVYADPRALVVDGERFAMTLRLWRLVGRGWWRDYSVTGTLGLQDGKLRLAADDVVEVGRSPGAGLVDPLAAIFEGRVLQAIEDAVQQSLPAARAEKVGAVRFAAAARSVVGKDGTLTIEGALDVKPAGKQ